MAHEERFGPFRLGHPIESEAELSAYVAFEEGSDRPLWLTLARDLELDAGSAAELAREMGDIVRVSGNLPEGVLPRVLAHGIHEGVPFLATPFPEGSRALGSILAGVEGRRLPPGLVATLASDLALALLPAHQQQPPLLHGHLRPEHLRVSVAGALCLSNHLPFAPLLAPERRAVGARSAGWSSFRPPELLRGGPPSIKGDLFGIGALIYWALTGEIPDGAPIPGHSAGHSQELAEKGERVPLAELAPSTPQELRALVDRLLNSEPSSRPPLPEVVGLLSMSAGRAPNARAALGALALGPSEPDSLADELRTTTPSPISVAGLSLPAPSSPLSGAFLAEPDDEAEEAPTKALSLVEIEAKAKARGLKSGSLPLDEPPAELLSPAFPPPAFPPPAPPRAPSNPVGSWSEDTTNPSFMADDKTAPLGYSVPASSSLPLPAATEPRPEGGAEVLAGPPTEPAAKAASREVAAPIAPPPPASEERPLGEERGGGRPTGMWIAIGGGAFFLVFFVFLIVFLLTE